MLKHAATGRVPRNNLFVCMRGRFLILPEMKFQAVSHPLQEIQVDIEGQAITEKETATILWFLKEVLELQSIMWTLVNTSYVIALFVHTYMQLLPEGKVNLELAAREITTQKGIGSVVKVLE